MRLTTILLADVSGWRILTALAITVVGFELVQAERWHRIRDYSIGLASAFLVFTYDTGVHPLWHGYILGLILLLLFFAMVVFAKNHRPTPLYLIGGFTGLVLGAGVFFP